MKKLTKITRPIAAAALIAVGAAADHAFTTTAASPNAATANAATTSKSAATSSTAATATDSVTEHAFAVASPSVVYVNNVGVGSGSGVIYDATGDIVTNAH